MILFPTRDEAIVLHQQLIAQFGGNEGLRDGGLLESALYRPQTGYYNSIIQMAAALMESLLINHPFIDGNKRMAFALTDIFLRMNGRKIRVDQKNGYDFICRVLKEKNFRRPLIEKWLEKHSEFLAPKFTKKI